jgi:hypothetical protein
MLKQVLMTTALAAILAAPIAVRAANDEGSPQSTTTNRAPSRQAVPPGVAPSAPGATGVPMPRGTRDVPATSGSSSGAEIAPPSAGATEPPSSVPNVRSGESGSGPATGSATREPGGSAGK